MSQTKIVATIGPATCNREALLELAEAGMSVARLNGSHADLDWHTAAIALIRETLPNVPILLDIPGRKIRTAQLDHEPSFDRGDRVVLTTDPDQAGPDKALVGAPALHEDLQPGATILADDGTLRFTVTEIAGRDIICRAETPGTLRSRKGINVPHVRLRGDEVTDRDRTMIDFARTNKVDFIGISFVESSGHVEAIRALVKGSWPRIVAKVENQGGLDHLEDIVGATDVIMIDRGDLSVETNLQNLALFQKRILAVARSMGKPVIVATEMLHTMVENAFPTKAEVSDITNAVLDGCAATMLSGETAIGKNPSTAVSVMRQISDVASGHLQTTLDDDRANEAASIPEVMGEAVALLCRHLSVAKIVAITISGYAARMVAARQPRQPIIAVSNDVMAVRSFNMLAGTEGFHVDMPFPRDSTDHIVKCLEALWRADKIADDDLILVTAVGYPKSGNRMNLIETHIVADLIDSLGWTR